MICATQDPHYTAKRLLRSAQVKPRTAHFGLVRGRKPKDALLGGSIDREDLVKSYPQEVLAVRADMLPETLAAAITAVWARLAVAIRKQVAG